MIDNTEGKEELIKLLTDMVDVANRVADKTAHSEIAFELVLSNLIKDFFAEECTCDGGDGIDQVGRKHGRTHRN